MISVTTFTYNEPKTLQVAANTVTQQSEQGLEWLMCWTWSWRKRRFLFFIIVTSFSNLTKGDAFISFKQQLFYVLVVQELIFSPDFAIQDEINFPGNLDSDAPHAPMNVSIWRETETETGVSTEANLWQARKCDWATWTWKTDDQQRHKNMCNTLARVSGGPQIYISVKTLRTTVLVTLTLTPQLCPNRTLVCLQHNQAQFPHPVARPSSTSRSKGVCALCSSLWPKVYIPCVA